MSQNEEVAKSETVPDYHTNSMLIAVTHLYGYDFMSQGTIDHPTSLYDFLDICVVASHYEIDDLLESTLKAADRALTDCLNDQDEEKFNSALKDFLDSSWDSILNEPRYTTPMLKVLIKHVHKMNSNQIFNELLDREPLLMHCIFFALAKDLGPIEAVEHAPLVKRLLGVARCDQGAELKTCGEATTH